MIAAVLGNLPLLASTPEGVARLRELILDMAVTGRLTGQPSTSGGSRGHQLPPLPTTWRYVPFNELIDPERPIAYGVLVPGPEVPTGIPFVRIADLSLNRPALLPEKTISPAIDAQFSRTRLRGGEILMGVVGSVGKLGIAPMSWAGANIARAICRIVPKEGVAGEFVVLLLQSTLMRQQFLGDTRTLAQPTLNVGLIRSASAPLPPAADQHRIVAKVNELMALCDRLEARQQDAKAAQARLVQVLLDSLTQARDTDEFQACWQRLVPAFAETFTSEASVEALMQAARILAFRGALSGDGMTDWKQCRVSDAVQFLNGYAFKSDWFVPQGIRLVRNVNIAHGSIDWRDVACIPDERSDEFAAFALNEGDVLLTLDRPIISTGLKVAVVRQVDLPCLLLQRVARLTPRVEQVRATFLLHWLRSPLFIGVIDPGRSNGVPHISTKQVGSMTIPLPPLDEQDRIVAILDELLVICDQLKTRIAAARAKHAQLVEALVQHATSPAERCTA